MVVERFEQYLRLARYVQDASARVQYARTRCSLIHHWLRHISLDLRDHDHLCQYQSLTFNQPPQPINLITHLILLLRQWEVG